MNAVGARIFRYSLPLRRATTAAGASFGLRDGLLLQLMDADGKIGWGDAAPLPGCSRETLREAYDALKCAAEFVCGGDTALWRSMPSSASFALETALDAATDEDSVAEVELSALLAGTYDEAMEKARRAGHGGVCTVKLKVGRGDWSEEVRLVAEVRETVGPSTALRLDANRAWDFDTAAAFSREVEPLNIAYIEEPLKDWRALTRLYEAAGVPFALDETLQEYRSALAAAARGDWPDEAAELRATMALAAACVVKPTLLHFHGLHDWLFRRSAEGPPIVISAAFESGVGIASLAKYAAHSSAHGLAAGLDTYDWLAEDVLYAPLPLQGGVARLDLLRAAAARVDTARLDTMFEFGALR